jgi:hypothetical protein
MVFQRKTIEDGGVKNDIHFWIATVARGTLALLTGSAVIVIPDLARTLLLLPFAAAISTVGLAAYVVRDSAVVFIISFMVSSRIPKVALRLQGAFGIIVGVLLFSVVYDRVRLHWFLPSPGYRSADLWIFACFRPCSVFDGCTYAVCRSSAYDVSARI